MDRRASPANDVMENGRVEEALRQSEQRLQQVINSAPVVLFAVDRQGIFTLSEGKGLAALGLLPGEAVGKSAFVRYGDNPEVIETIRRALGGEDVTAVGEIRGRIYECRCSPTRSLDGEVSGAIGVATDITESRTAERALRRSEQRLQQVIDSAPVLLFATDRNGIYTLSEGSEVQSFGARPGEAVGKSAFERYREIPAITDSIRRALAGERFTALAEIRGRTYECLCSPTVGEQGDVTGMIGVATDITERRRAERQSRRLLEELAQTGRISTLGEMASGLSHELNQPLAAIVAYVDACLELVESGKMDNQQLAVVLRSVSNQAERAGQIIHRLRKMIRRSQPVRAPMSVNDAVREIAVLLESETRQADVTVDLELGDGLPDAAADFLQVQQVVQHLVRNGLEAMADVPTDQRRLMIATRPTPAGEVEIAVRDFGHGLAAASAEQIFEPFFSTKTNGLGLGLSISRTIVEAHGGRIWITPNATHGVTARFTLPAGAQKGSP
ncbi:MAG TPA: PAS domain-containing protein [Planctomycetaceae bacterium]|jgi:PAS domain S-box-containing protein|nr:PAS domain-containing protein [Planctomycetaceae bacterium]